MMERNENLLTTLGSDFTKELDAVVKSVLEKSGVKNNSELIDSVEWVYTRDSLQMYVNEYYESVSKGRKPLAKKIPIYSIINWIKESRVTSSKYPTGRLAYIIQNSIYKRGITGKHFLEQVESTVGDTVEIRVADGLEELLADSLYSSFKVSK